MIYAVDFDGYLCTNAWPDIGKPRTVIIDHFRGLKEMGHKLILWTCREGEMLQKAIDWCAEWKTNSNYPDTVICSVCGYREDVWWEDKGKYCPNCAAKMGESDKK